MKKISLHNFIFGLLTLFSFNVFSSPIASSSNTLSSSPSEDLSTATNNQSQVSNKNIEQISSKNQEPKGCKYWLPLFKPFCHRLHQVWTEGYTELYFSGYAWHNRFTYSAERLQKKHYNELAWGGGFGKGFFDEKGNWHSLYAIAFLDSHRNVQPTIGYNYLKVAHFTKDFKAGLGFSLLITARPDILHNIPFPGAVPWAGLFYKKISIKAAYIPGSSSNGNVLYLVGSYAFDK